MPILLRTSGVVFCLAAALFSPVASAQLSTPLGSEYSLTGEVPGDQAFPRVALGTNGGYVVWQDNRTDGFGLGISARKLNNNFSPSLASFRVNQQAIGDQRHPDITMLTNGAAAIVWQGNRTGRHDQVWLRILSTNGTFTTTNDLRVSTYTNGPQTSPTIATLANGTLLVAWGNTFQDGSYQGVFARLLTAAGAPIAQPFQVNQFTPFNQRNPAVASLPDGGFVITWLSENQGVNSVDLSRGTNRVHVYARLYDYGGVPRGDEFRVNTGRSICTQPDVAASTDGSFTIIWAEHDSATERSWDVLARAFNSSGLPVGEPFTVNGYTLGEQHSPKISAIGNVYMAVWASLGQETSANFARSLLISGIYGRLIAEGAPNGGEFQVNTTIVSKQHQPTIASDKADRFLAAWSSFTGPASFDVLAQRFTSGQPLPRPDAPFVSALSSSRLLVTWPELLGFSVTGYEIYIDGAMPPASPTAVVSSNMWSQSGFAPGSTHTFRLAYIVGAQRSSLSDPGSGTTWGEDENMDGLPDDWQARYWGSKPEDWPGRNVDSDGDGANNGSEYLAGTDPTDPASVLRTWISRSPQGRRLNWSTQPGLIYQVQTANGFGGGWVNFGSARFAAGSSDSILLSGNVNAAFYRIIRVR